MSNYFDQFDEAERPEGVAAISAPETPPEPNVRDPGEESRFEERANSIRAQREKRETTAILQADERAATAETDEKLEKLNQTTDVGKNYFDQFDSKEVSDDELRKRVRSRFSGGLSDFGRRVAPKDAVSIFAGKAGIRTNEERLKDLDERMKTNTEQMSAYTHQVKRLEELRKVYETNGQKPHPGLVPNITAAKNVLAKTLRQQQFYERIKTGKPDANEQAEWRAAINSAAGTFTKAFVGSAAKFAGAIQHQLGMGGDMPEDTGLWQFGEATDKFASEMFPEDVAKREDFLQKLSHGAGSMAAFMGHGFVGRLAGMGPNAQLAVMAVSGGAQQGTAQYEEAKQYLIAAAKLHMKETGEKIQVNQIQAKAMQAMGWGFLLGLTEAVPFVRPFRGGGPRGLGGVAARAGQQGLEEAGQETLVGVGENTIAANIYDPTRKIEDGVADAAMVGGLLGAFLGGVGGVRRQDFEQVIARVKAARRMRTEAETPGKPEEKVIGDDGSPADPNSIRAILQNIDQTESAELETPAEPVPAVTPEAVSKVEITPTDRSDMVEVAKAVGLHEDGETDTETIARLAEKKKEGASFSDEFDPVLEKIVGVSHETIDDNSLKTKKKSAERSELASDAGVAEVKSYIDLVRMGREQQAKIETLTDFIRARGGVADPSGELAALNVDERNTRGRKRLIQANGSNLDDLALAAHEAGFFAERPTEADLLDAIDEDTRFGNVVREDDLAEQENNQFREEARVESERLGFTKEMNDTDVAAHAWKVAAEIREQEAKDRAREARERVREGNSLEQLGEFITDGGDLSDLEAISNRTGLEGEDLSALLEQAVEQGTLRQHRGRYYRNVEVEVLAAAGPEFQAVMRDMLRTVENGDVFTVPQPVQNTILAEIDVNEDLLGGVPAKTLHSVKALRVDGFDRAKNTYEVLFRGSDGSLDRLVLPFGFVFGASAIHAPGRGIFINAVIIQEGLEASLRGTLRHEVTHALWRGGFSEDLKERLLRHADNLNYFNRLTLIEYLRAIGNPSGDVTSNDVEAADIQSLEQRYQEAYKGREAYEIEDLIQQEKVAIMLELNEHGYWTAEEMEPIKDDLLALDAPAGAIKSDDALEMALANTLPHMTRVDGAGFYSKALDAAVNLKQEKGTPQQMLAQLKKAGVKKAELEATGLDLFLEGLPQVTRSGIVAFLELNRVKLNETIYDRDESEIVDILDQIERMKARGARRDDPKFIALLERHSELQGLSPQWATYSVEETNPTYQETVLHLPEPARSKNQIRDEMNIIYGELSEIRRATERGESGAKNSQRAEKLRADLDVLQREMDDRRQATFYNSNFSEPNAVLHLRTSIHPDADGKSHFVINELQSDWGQKVRDMAGKGIDVEKRDNLVNEIEGLKVRLKNLLNQRGFYDVEFKDLQKTGGLWRYGSQRIPQSANDIAQHIQLKQLELHDVEDEIAPSNPLVANTDTWVPLGLKKALLQAVEAGADYVSIASGATVDSYGMGAEVEGNNYAYDQMYPKKMREIIKRIDKEAANGIKVQRLRRSYGEGEVGGANYLLELGPVGDTVYAMDASNRTAVEQFYNPDNIEDAWAEARAWLEGQGTHGFVSFPITPKLKEAVESAGLPMFSLSANPIEQAEQPLASLQWLPAFNLPGKAKRPGVVKGLNAILRDLSLDLNVPLRQGKGFRRFLGYNINTGITRQRVYYNIREFSNNVGDAFASRYEDMVDELENNHGREFAKLGGFAGFVQVYILNPQAAENAVPNGFKAFERELEKAAPGTLQKLHKAQADIARYHQADPAAQFESMIVPAKVGRPLMEKLTEMDPSGLLETIQMRVRMSYTDRLDRAHPFHLSNKYLLRLYEQNTGHRLNLTVSENAEKLLRLAPMAHSWAGQDLEHGIRNRLTNEHQGPSIVDALKLALGSSRAEAMDLSEGSRYRQFGGYLVARRAVRLWERYEANDLERPPVQEYATKASAIQAIQLYEKRFPTFANGAAMLYGFQEQLLELQRDAGLISDEQFDELILTEDYVPFLRAFDETTMLGSGKTVSGKYSILKQFRGSARDIVDPVASIAQKVYDTRQIIALNDAKRALLNLAEQAGPGGGIIAERLDAKELKPAQRNVIEGLKKAARELGVDKHDELALLGLAQSMLGNDAWVTEFTSQYIQEGQQPIVWFFENGQPVAMRLGDGWLGRTMFDSLQNFGEEHTSNLIKLLSMPTQFIRGGITAHPEFIAANMFRDGPLAFMYDWTMIPWWTQIDGFVRALANGKSAQEYAANAGLMGGVQSSSLDKLRMDRDMQTLVEKGYKPKIWEDPATWAQSMAYKLGIDSGMGALRVGGGAAAGFMLGGPYGAAIGGVAGTLLGKRGREALAHFTEASETGTRIKLYNSAKRRAKSHGLNDVDAANEASFFAQDYMDYSRRGSKMADVTRLVAFMNAALVGINRYYRLLFAQGDYGSAHVQYLRYRMGQSGPLTEREQFEIAQSAQTWAVSIIMLGGISMLVSSMWDDDDERLEDIPRQVRDKHWIIPLDGTLHLVPKELPGLRQAVGELTDDRQLRLPKPFETAWFANLVEHWIRDRKKGDPRWWENYTSSLWEVMHPPLEPNVTAFGYGLWSGKDTYTGRDIIPFFDKGSRVENLYGPYTSELGKTIGKATGIAPYYVDWGLKALGTSWARDALNLNVPGTPNYDPNKAEKGIDEYILARRFTWRTGKGSEARRVFYDMFGGDGPLQGIQDKLITPYSKLGGSAKDFGDALEAADPASAYDILKSYTPRERGHALLMEFAKGKHAKLRMLDPMYRARRQMRIVNKVMKEIHSNTFTQTRGDKRVPLNPSQKKAARDILTQYQMMAAHNALVVTKEHGWAQKATFNVNTAMAELSSAVPEVHKEVRARLNKAKILSFAGVREQWDTVKEIIEDPATVDLLRSGKDVVFTAKLGLPYSRALAKSRR